MRHGRSLVLIFAVLSLAAGCRSSSGTDTAPRKPPTLEEALSSDPEAVARAAAAEQRASEAKAAAAKANLARVQAESELAKAKLKADNAVNLGNEAAKRSLVQAATAVGVVGAAIALVSGLALVASFFIGGIGRKTALIGLALAAGCIEFRFFILSRGLLVSEAISWAVMAGLCLGGGIVATMGIRYLWHWFDARGMAAGAAAAGEPARDAIAVLPVPQKVRGQLHSAWESLRTGAASGSAGDGAKQLLSRFGLAVPMSPATAAPTGAAA